MFPSTANDYNTKCQAAAQTVSAAVSGGCLKAPNDKTIATELLCQIQEAIQHLGSNTSRIISARDRAFGSTPQTGCADKQPQQIGVMAQIADELRRLQDIIGIQQGAISDIERII